MSLDKEMKEMDIPILKLLQLFRISENKLLFGNRFAVTGELKHMRY